MKTNRFLHLSPLERPATTKAAPTLRFSHARSSVQKPALSEDRRTAGRPVKSVLVPLDGSTFAEQAIPLALGIAEQCGAVLHLVHVIVPVEVLDPYDALYFADESLAALKRDKHRYLAEISRQISANSSVLVAAHVVDGRAVPPTLDAIPGLNTDLVVMATHGRGVAGRFWWGSVAHSVLRRLSVPVILVRGDNEGAKLASRTIDHVLLPLSGAKASEKVLDPILGLGMFSTARHTLLHVVPREPKHIVQDYALRTEWIPSRRHWVTGMQYLQPWVRSLSDRGRDVRAKVVSSDEPIGQLILRSAERADARLIAVAYRKRWRAARLLWPTCTDYLYRNSSIPLMFVPV
jgi:nucleotide-binding universal stress UspA family protein